MHECQESTLNPNNLPPIPQSPQQTRRAQYSETHTPERCVKHCTKTQPRTLQHTLDTKEDDANVQCAKALLSLSNDDNTLKERVVFNDREKQEYYDLQCETLKQAMKLLTQNEKCLGVFKSNSTYYFCTK